MLRSKPKNPPRRPNGSKVKNPLNNSLKPQIAPVAVSAAQNFKVLGRSRPRSFRFQNSELVASLAGTVSFSARKYAVNPGLSVSFPWLSSEASKWEQYRFHKIRYRYVTRTSTSTVGSVILSPDYNVRDIAPATEVAATDTQDAVEDCAWKEICCDLDPLAMYPVGPRKLVRTSMVSGDLNLYDSANMFICTVEQTGTDSIGKIWVDYDVEFFVPQNSPSDYTKSSNCSIYGRSSAQTFTTTVGDNILWDAATSDPLGIGSQSGGLFTPPAGTYKVYCQGEFLDSSAENFAAQMALVFNGGGLTPPVITLDNRTALAGGSTPLHLLGVVSCSGSDTVALTVTLTGAAGTLTLKAATGYLLWVPV